MGDVTKLVEQVLGACGLQEGRARDALVADLLEVGLKWGLQMSQYRARAGRLFPPGAETCPGHILQIFVKNSIVDSVAYGARLATCVRSFRAESWEPQLTVSLLAAAVAVDLFRSVWCARAWGVVFPKARQGVPAHGRQKTNTVTIQA